MTDDVIQSASSPPEQHLLRGWRSVMFAPVGSGQRRRRGSDGVRLAAAVLVLVCCLLVIRYDSRIDRAITQVIHPPPWSITWLVTVVYEAGSIGVAVVLVGLALLARRWEVARDIGLSAAGTAAVCGILIALLGSRGGRPGGIVIDGYYMSFPVLQIALFMAVATAGLPYLARGVQRLIEIFIALVALASAVGGHGLPLNVLGSLVIGWGVTAVVRLVFGSPLGLPSAEDVRLLLEEFGIRSRDVRPVTRQVWGVARFEATELCRADTPGRLGIAVYGRDAADARLLTKAGRFLLYRDSGPSLTITRLQQVEHEAYVTMRAGLADVAVPEIVEAGTAGPSRDALLVYRTPPGTALSDTDAAEISDATLDDLYRQLLTLRRARIAHGAISGDAVLVDPVAGTVVLADFRNASERASPDQLDRDLAGAIAATAVVIGAERAADAAARCLEPQMMEGALRQLQKPALDPLLARSLRGRREPAAGGPGARRGGGRDRAADPGRAAPGELAHADHDHRQPDRRLGPDRGAHRRGRLLRHRDRGRLAVGHHGVRPGPAGLRGVGRGEPGQRGRAVAARPDGGRRSGQGVQRAGRRRRPRSSPPGCAITRSRATTRRWH